SQLIPLAVDSAAAQDSDRDREHELSAVAGFTDDHGQSLFAEYDQQPIVSGVDAADGLHAVLSAVDDWIDSI
ncbi:MAG: hypothetical protein ABGZ17_11550, partial [Planctomycetaceae bacterium]